MTERCRWLQTANSEWTTLLKEPAKSLYKRHMRVDFKGKFDRSDEEEDDDVWASHEFRVEKVTASNVDDAISSGIAVLMFFPTWVHPQFSVHWAHNFASAAQALEGRATLAAVNALAESAAPVIKRFGVGLAQHDGNTSRPEFRVFVDDGQLVPEGYSGEVDTNQLIALVQRLEGVCDDTPCPAVHRLVAEADLELLMGRHELSAIAVGMKESDGVEGALANVTRSLQVSRGPPCWLLACVSEALRWAVGAGGGASTIQCAGERRGRGMVRRRCGIQHAERSGPILIRF